MTNNGFLIIKYLWFDNFKYRFKKKIKLRKNSSFNWFTPFHVLIRPDVIWKNLSRPLYHVHFTVIHTNSRHKFLKSDADFALIYIKPDQDYKFHFVYNYMILGSRFKIQTWFWSDRRGSNQRLKSTFSTNRSPQTWTPAWKQTSGLICAGIQTQGTGGLNKLRRLGFFLNSVTNGEKSVRLNP